MLSTRTSRWVAGAVALCLLLLVLTYLLLVSPRTAQAAELADADAAAVSQNDSLRIRTAQLKAQFVTLPQKQAELAEILRQVPPTADTPALVRTIDQLAVASGVDLQNITPGAATLLEAPGGVAAAAPAGSAVAPAGAVVSVPQTLAVEGDYFQVVAFLRKLQTEMKRAFLVTGLEVSSTAGGGSGTATQGQVTVTITGSTFVLAGAQTPSATPGATPGGTPPATPGPAAAPVSPGPTLSPGPAPSPGTALPPTAVRTASPTGTPTTTPSED